MNRRYRALGIVLLLAATVGLCVLYAGAELWAQPSNDAVVESPTDVDGQQALLFGEVLSTDHDQQTAVIEIQEIPQVTVTVTNIRPEQLDQIETGASIQVFGTLEDDSSIIVADNIVIDYRGPADRLYVYATSILGGLLAAGYFLRYWRIEWRQLRFTPRGES